jgi:hypothetical protein
MLRAGRYFSQPYFFNWIPGFYF